MHSNAASTITTMTELEHHPKRTSKISRLDTHDDFVIDPSLCCTCFTSYTYEDDLDWVLCACGRRLHEDCVEDIVIDCHGQERACPFCLDILSL